MTGVVISTGDPRDPAARALLQASHELMESLYPSEANHYLSVDELCADTIDFYVARRGAETLGCAALARRDGYGEVKSMFVSNAARGSGTGGALLAQIETAARAAGLSHLRLETGNTLYAAHRLYARAGFVPCSAFGGYSDDPISLFMEKPL